MAERTGLVTLLGNPVTLAGSEVKVGDKAPDFKVVTTDLQPVTLADTAGKVRIFCAVPSLDTPVCSVETKRFNEEAARLGENVGVYVISMDLPFAQSRWCGAENVKNVQTLSDYQERAFGENYGVLIKEVKLLARSIFVVDKNDTVRYIELVSEVAQEPNYDAALAAAKEAAGA